MITLIFYYIFSVLFMIGYENTHNESIGMKILISIVTILSAPIMLPVNLGYWIYKNS